MILDVQESGSSYLLTPVEEQELTHWFDQVISVSEPEDVTGQIFVDNFIRDDKALRLTSCGLATAMMRRESYNNHVLTDVVIENEKIHETNAKKGIFFDVSVPELGHGFSTYEVMFGHEAFSSPRYTSLMYAGFIPPNAESPDYKVDIQRALHRDIKSRSGCDYIRYKVKANEGRVETTIAVDPIDIPRGAVTLRPLRNEDLATNSLREHARFIAEVVGIRAPEFLD